MTEFIRDNLAEIVKLFQDRNVANTFMVGLFLGPMLVWASRGSLRYAYRKVTRCDQPYSQLATEILNDLSGGGRGGCPWMIKGHHLVTSGISILPTRKHGTRIIMVNGVVANRFLSSREEKAIYSAAQAVMTQLERTEAMRNLGASLDYMRRR